MGEIRDAQRLAGTLPGSWSVGATSLPGWSFNAQVPLRFTYELVTEAPLVLTHAVAFETSDGKPKTVTGRTRWRGGQFLSSTNRFTPLNRGRWTVNGLSDDGNIVVFSLSRSLGVPESVFVLVRSGAGVPDLRALVAGDCATFGLTPERFASLTWL